MRTETPESDGPLHVLVVSNHWGVEGNTTRGGIFVDRQIAALRRAGVRVGTFDAGTRHAPGALLERRRELARRVRQLRPDLVHARYGTVVAALSVLAGAPAVITYGGSDLLAGASISAARTRGGIALSNLAALKARALICVSEELRRALWWRRGRAVVIPDGVDLELFTPGSKEEARRRLGWGPGPVALINAARDPANKGLPLAEAAMEVARGRLAPAHPAARLEVIPGVPPERMPLYYRAADVLICASRQEGSPNVVKEALACDLPVVSTPVGDVPERLAGVEHCAVVPRDPRAMAEALLPLLAAPRPCAGRRAVAHLGLDAVAARVIEVYEGVLDRRHRPARLPSPASPAEGVGAAEVAR